MAFEPQHVGGVLQDNSSAKTVPGRAGSWEGHDHNLPGRGMVGVGVGKILKGPLCPRAELGSIRPSVHPPSFTTHPTNRALTGHRALSQTLRKELIPSSSGSLVREAPLFHHVPGGKTKHGEFK